MLLLPPRRPSLLQRQQGFIINPFALAAGNASDAADFDGTNDKMSAGALTGQANSDSFIFSCWVKPDTLTTGAVSGRLLFMGWDTGAPVNSQIKIMVRMFSGGQITLFCVSTANNTACQGSMSVNLTTTAWHHILIAVDLSASAIKMYLNDVDRTSGTFVNSSVTFGWGVVDNWYVSDDARDVSNLDLWDGGIADLYFAPGQFLDLTVEANRRKFISATGKPVSLGTTGSTPTGTAPLIFLHLNDGDAPANFATNRTGAGNFTISGALTAYPSSPSD